MYAFPGTEIGNVNIYNILGPCISGGLDKSAVSVAPAEAQMFNNASVRFRRMATHPLNKFLAPEPQVRCTHWSETNSMTSLIFRFHEQKHEIDNSQCNEAIYLLKKIVSQFFPTC